MGPDVLLITCGLPLTCKSRASERIAAKKGYSVLRTDTIRLEVLKGEDVFDETIASDMDRRMRVYDEAFRRADEALQKGGGAIIDATFITQALRRRAASLAARHYRTFVILETRSPREVSLARIWRRTREDYESNAITEQAYLNNEKMFEPVDLDDLKQSNPNLDILHLMVDTQYDAPEDWYVVGMVRR